MVRSAHPSTFPNPRNLGAAVTAVIAFQMQLADLVAGALDEQLAAAVAIGALRRVAGNIAQVDVFQARLKALRGRSP